MTLFRFRQKLKHLSTILVIVDAEGHEVFNDILGTYIHWVKAPMYNDREIDYITPEDDNMFIIYLED